MTKTIVAIASKNPVKIAAVKLAFTNMLPLNDYEFLSLDIEGKAPAQPVGDKETLRGASTRALAILRHYKEKEKFIPDYSIGIEGGIEFTILGAVAFAYVYIMSKGTVNYTKTTPFLLPYKVGDLLAQGLELGDADDIVFKKENSKQKNGAVGILTKNKITRKDYYSTALALALIPFANEELYKKEPTTKIHAGVSATTDNLKVKKGCSSCGKKH